MNIKADPKAQELLLQVQELDTRVQRLTHRAHNLPETETIANLKTEIEKLVGVSAEQFGVLEDAKAELARTESDVQLVQARVIRDRERLASSTSVKDVQGLETELNALARRLSDLEDIELSVMERVEEEEAKCNSARLAEESFRAQLEEAKTARDVALVTIEKEREECVRQRAQLLEKIPPDLAQLYERQRERYGVGASLLRRGVSSASGVALNEADLGVVRRAAPDDVLLCPDSNAILVRTAESGL